MSGYTVQPRGWNRSLALITVFSGEAVWGVFDSILQVVLGLHIVRGDNICVVSTCIIFFHSSPGIWPDMSNSSDVV